MDTQIIRHVSDTAHWAAWYRARETERSDALFRDPYAASLCGVRGEEIVTAIPARLRNAWSWVARTVLFDLIIAEQVASGADLVVNLAAGLDARPYRLALPPSLLWIEVDHPWIIDEKEQILAGEKPACILERVRLDHADVAARRVLFTSLAARASNALIISEGLLLYLKSDEVGALAMDLAGFRHWAFDIVSPPLLRMLQRTIQPLFGPDAAAFAFGPPEGPDFFLPYGWKPVMVNSALHAAAKLKRLSLLMRLFARVPDSPKYRQRHPWSGTCLMARSEDVQNG